MHHAEHRSSSRQAWPTAVYIATALIAPALHRAADLDIVAALVLGFGVSGALIGVAHVIVTKLQPTCPDEHPAPTASRGSLFDKSGHQRVRVSSISPVCGVSTPWRRGLSTLAVSRRVVRLTTGG